MIKESLNNNLEARKEVKVRKIRIPHRRINKQIFLSMRNESLDTHA